MPTATQQTDAATTLCKATLRAADWLDLSPAQLGGIIGVDRSTISRWSKKQALNPQSKSGQLALGFLRVYRALFALNGGDRDNMRHWLNSDNLHLHDKPIDLMMDPLGLAEVVGYLDAIRARI